MGSGGIIIIRQKVKETAELDQVKNCLSPTHRASLEAILAKDVHDWTAEEFRLVLRYIGHSHEDC